MSAAYATENTTSGNTAVSKIPLMKWSQTRDNVHLVVEIRSLGETYTPEVHFAPHNVTMKVNTKDTHYNVDAELYGAILPDSSSWRIAANGHLIVTLAKRFVDDDEDSNEQATEANEASDDTENTTTKEKSPEYRYCSWWDHPFYDRAYKGFVKIDWTRWVDDPDDHMGEDDEDSDDGQKDLGPLSEASPFDFGGDQDGALPSEQGNMFQNMMKEMGGENGLDMPNMEELAKNFDMNKMEEMMKTLGTDDMTGLDGLKNLDMAKMGNLMSTLGLNNESNSEEDTEEDDEQDTEHDTSEVALETTDEQDEQVTSEVSTEDAPEATGDACVTDSASS